MATTPKIYSITTLRKDIDKVVSYNWSDELADFRDHEGEDEHHIFSTLVRLDNWIRGTTHAPEYYLKERK